MAYLHNVEMGQRPDTNELYDTVWKLSYYTLESNVFHCSGPGKGPLPRYRSVWTNHYIHRLYTVNTKLSKITQLPECRENTVLESRLCFVESLPINHLRLCLWVTTDGQGKVTIWHVCIYLKWTWLKSIIRGAFSKWNLGTIFRPQYLYLHLGKFYSILSTYDANTVRTKLLRSWQKYSWFHADFFFKK